MVIGFLIKQSQSRSKKHLESERQRAIQKAKETRVEWIVVLNARLQPQAFSQNKLKRIAKQMNKSFTEIRKNALFVTPKEVYTQR